ncbi:hypothetical protein ACHAWF_010829 [Thalassiosira exigua]
MAHYRKDAASNRDALFGGGGGGGGGGGRNRSAAGGGGGGGGRPSASSSSRATSASASRPSAASSSSSANPFAASSSSSFPSSAASRSHASSSPSGAAPGPSRIFASSGSIARNVPLSTLSGQAKIAKMAEAEDYRLKVRALGRKAPANVSQSISSESSPRRAGDDLRLRFRFRAPVRRAMVSLFFEAAEKKNRRSRRGKLHRDANKGARCRYFPR